MKGSGGVCHHLTCCRYVVCKGYIDVERNVSRYLLDVNDQLNDLRDTAEDVLEVSGGGGGPTYARSHVRM